MKKIFALALVIMLAFLMVACTEPAPVDDNNQVEDQQNQEVTQDDQTTEQDQTPAEEEKVMTYEEYMAAELDSPVVVETFVQAKQSWWQDKATVYTQNSDGAYFIYEMACSEEDYAELVPGTKIKVKGFKSEWSGEIEIVDATFEIMENEIFVANPMDATALLGTDELIAHQNKLVSFSGMTVESIEYKNGEPGDDIYVTLSKDGVSYNFCVEVYLTGTESEVYNTVGTLEAGNTVNVEAFLYWYEGANPHITAIELAE
ncbi:MAG: hypothetical protein IJO74_02520 [Clostridia bacterium]|nr:hypothetical protein [Clostridia bacterium]